MRSPKRFGEAFIQQISSNEFGDQIHEQFVVNDAIIPPTLLNNAIAEVGIQAQTGSWAWSGWQNYTVTVNGKITVQAVAVAITSYIPKVGPLAAGLATVWIQYNLKTGYFKRQIGSRADTDPRYYWQRIRVNLYKDSARKNLISSRTSAAQRLFIHW